MKERASTLTIHSCGAQCTYSLYDKQVNGAGAWRTERGRFPVARAFSQCFLRAPIRNRNRKGGKKIRKREAFYWFPNLLLLKAALSRLDFGPAYYEDPVSSNPI
ncbi:hypothetical protein Lal_00001813 [Lupinus albus]|nr:hypothetical protein Lal_00001813 [Lupinus albus]